MANIKYYFPGSILMLIAIVAVLVPEILVALVAASIFMVGIVTFCIGHMIRKSERGFRDIDRWFFDKEFYGWRFAKVPKVRIWYRDF